MPIHIPEPIQRRRQTEHFVSAATEIEASQHRPEVRMLSFQTVKDLWVRDRLKLGRELLPKSEEPLCVRVADRLLFIARRQSLQPELPHRLKHPVAGIVLWPFLDQQTLV